MIHPQPRPQRIRDASYKDWITALPCLTTVRSGPDDGCTVTIYPFGINHECSGPIDPHHVIPKGGGKVGSKVDDRRCVPLCRKHHDEAQSGRDNFEAKYGILFEYEILELQKRYKPEKPKRAPKLPRMTSRRELAIQHGEVRLKKLVRNAEKLKLKIEQWKRRA